MTRATDHVSSVMAWHEAVGNDCTSRDGLRGALDRLEQREKHSRKAPWTWRLSVALIVASVLAVVSAADLASAKDEAGAPQVGSPAEWREWRQSMTDLRYRLAETSLRELRSRYEAARARGDQHTEWMYLAWLASETSAIDFAASAPLLTLADQAIEAAQRTDKVAAFELVVMVEAARIRQHNEPPREGRLLLAQSLADELDDPQRQGLVHQLRGLAATYTGQEGEALFEYRRAREFLTSPYDDAELKYCMALALFDDPSTSAVEQTQRYLQDVEAAFPPERFPGFVDVLARQSLLMSSLNRPDSAVALAQRSILVARRSGLATPLAQAQMALGYAYLAAQTPALAASAFKSEWVESLGQRGKLRTITGQALALALLKDRSALAVLEQGRQLVQRQGDPGNLVAADFYEASSRVRQAAGDDSGALADLALAGSLRSTMANSARERLVQARIAATTKEAEAAVERIRRQRLLVGVLGLAAAVTMAVSLCLYQFRQRRTIGQLAADLQQANARLEAANAATSRHLAIACHELRQPAHVLGLIADSPSSRASTPDSMEQQSLAVRNCSRTLTEMLEALMDTARLQHGTYAPQLEAVDLADVLAEVDIRYRKPAHDKGLNWRVTSPRITVISDRHLLSRVLFNLASNAVRYTAVGGVQIQAAISGHRAVVEVIDTGAGIPVEKLDAPCDSEDSTEDAGESGVGLYVVRRACKILGHELSVPLSSSRGSIVRVAVNVHEEALHIEPAEDVAAGSQTVAIVEADPLARQALANALRLHGYNIAPFASLEALARVSTMFGDSLPGAVVLDVQLNRRDDATLLKRLRRSPAWERVRFIVLTGDVSPQTTALATELDIGLAYKPVSALRLREQLSRVLGRQPRSANSGGISDHLEVRPT